MVFIGTFPENIPGKMQSLDQGSILAEKKDDYWNIRGKYKIYNELPIPRQVRFVAPRSIAGTISRFVILFVKEKSWKT